MKKLQLTVGVLAFAMAIAVPAVTSGASALNPAKATPKPVTKLKSNCTKILSPSVLGSLAGVTMSGTPTLLRSECYGNFSTAEDSFAEAVQIDVFSYSTDAAAMAAYQKQLSITTAQYASANCPGGTSTHPTVTLTSGLGTDAFLFLNCPPASVNPSSVGGFYSVKGPLFVYTFLNPGTGTGQAGLKAIINHIYSSTGA